MTINIEKKDNDSFLLSCGFVIITTTCEDIVEEEGIKQGLFTHKDIQEQSPTWRKFWDEYTALNLRVERNVLHWLNKKLDGVRDEGHNDNELIGTCWFNPTNKQQLDFVMTHAQQSDNTDDDYKLEFYKGIDTDLPCDIRIEFFAISDEVYYAWEDNENDIDSIVTLWKD